jgi:transcriptional regulator with XRE-family HTH domain
MGNPNPPRYIPSARAMLLRSELKRHRKAAQLTAEAAAAALGWSQGKLSHLERGRNQAKPADVARMLELYGVESPERDAIIALARDAGRRDWWTNYSGVFTTPFVALEDVARKIREWAPLLIPGLLQTPDYARAVLTRDDVDLGEIERRIQARKNRQVILGRDKPPELHVILAELLLLREVGSPFVMRAQLHKLIDEAQRPNVTIQVLPRNSPVIDGLDGMLTIFGFPADYPDVAYTEGFHGATILENRRVVRRCNVAFERLRGAALTPQESADLIAAAAQHE